MKRKTYVSPAVSVYRVELEGTITATNRLINYDHDINVEDFSTGDNGESNIWLY
jgi:hypothetical protein